MRKMYRIFEPEPEDEVDMEVFVDLIEDFAYATFLIVVLSLLLSSYLASHTLPCSILVVYHWFVTIANNKSYHFIVYEGQNLPRK